jgi:predicted glycosyltransferase involved in capsule biosynthesis
LLSIIVSWRDRVELGRALPSLVAAARRANGDVTIVNFSGASELLQRQLGDHRGEVRVVEVPGQAYFNKSSAQNVGAASTSQPVLFFCDCDIVLEPDSVAQLARQLVTTDGIFATLAGVRESEANSRRARHVVSFGYELHIKTADGRELAILDSEEDSQTGLRHAPGLLVVRRTDFVAINGYNAGLHGWGWEDQDMIARLTLGRGLRRVMSGNAIHLSHDDHARIAHYPAVTSRWESRDRMFRTALANYDDNHFLGTYDRDRDLVAAAPAPQGG